MYLTELAIENEVELAERISAFLPKDKKKKDHTQISGLGKI